MKIFLAAVLALAALVGGWGMSFLGWGGPGFAQYGTYTLGAATVLLVVLVTLIFRHVAL